MGRPFIEFIQSQQLPWVEKDYICNIRGRVLTRELSTDSDTGACSLLIKYSSNYQQSIEGYLSADEEFFVLDGEISIDGERYGRYNYGHFPKGLVSNSITSSGAVVLTFFDKKPELISAVADSAELESERIIKRIDALAGEWGGNFNPDFPPGAGRKWMRRDPVTKDETWILGTMPLRYGMRSEKHPVVEEAYLLSGELVGHLGIMTPGAYFWRPPEEPHGPFGSMTGNLYLFRTVGGPLSTIYEPDSRGFNWKPKHDPILPGALAALPEFDGCTCQAY
ncbi:MAG: DUF4437 domain-containing protein [Candidatus Planktophila sp.]|tara:strand:+ start:2217 stop:3053 length:837 start_codon:yes stop_codon:yes gene_type:complete